MRHEVKRCKYFLIFNILSYYKLGYFSRPTCFSRVLFCFQTSKCSEGGAAKEVHRTALKVIVYTSSIVLIIIIV